MVGGHRHNSEFAIWIFAVVNISNMIPIFMLEKSAVGVYMTEIY